MILAADVGKVGDRRRVGTGAWRRRPQHRERRPPGEVRAHFEQAARRMHDRIADQRRLACARLRQHERAAGAARGERHRQRAADRAQLAGQRQFAGEFMRGERRLRELAGGRKHAERNRQVEAAGLLGQVGGRQVDRELARREVEVRVLQRGANAVARLLDLGFRQPDQVEPGQTVAGVALDGDQRRVETRETARQDDGE